MKEADLIEMEKQKEGIYDALIDSVGRTKGNVKAFRSQLQVQDDQMEDINNHLDKLVEREKKVVNGMERYLKTTSDCKLYMIIGILLLVFIMLMSI